MEQDHPMGTKKTRAIPKKIVPDPEAAQVVKHIFKLCAEGRGPKQIARQLTEEQAVNPSNYYFNQTGVALTNLDTTRPYRWIGSSIVNILNDETYLGHTVSMKHTTASYKNKKQIIRPESEWLRFENTHEAIITQDVWDIAHEVRMHKKRPRKNMENPNPYSGLVICADCGKPLVLHRAHTMDESKNNFACSTYKKYGKETCSAHYIRESQLAAVILDDLKRVTHFARQDEMLFAECINRKKRLIREKKSLRCKRNWRLCEKGIWSLPHFSSGSMRTMCWDVYRMSTTEPCPMSTPQNRKSYANAYQNPKPEWKSSKNSLTNVDRFIEKAKKYTDLTELTPELIRMFIAKVVVGEKAEKYSRTARRIFDSLS